MSDIVLNLIYQENSCLNQSKHDTSYQVYASQRCHADRRRAVHDISFASLQWTVPPLTEGTINLDGLF